MTSPDWNTLERLRQGFLEGTAGKSDYWQSESDVESYDCTFAQRIGWKWRYVIEELQRMGWQLPQGNMTDYGCGSGIAGRTVIEMMGIDSCSELCLHDRSPLAMQVATRKAQEQFPQLQSRAMQDFRVQGGTVLISHVITELSAEQIETLCRELANADAVIWVEPGTYGASRSLISAREILRKAFHIVAPCLHQKECGMINPVNHRHWCHFFATPPDEAFTQREWAQFAENAGIDLSDLPLSYLVLDKRPRASHPVQSLRLIARAHTTKQDAVIIGCNESGVKEYIATKKNVPEFYRLLKKDKHASIVKLRLSGKNVLGMEGEAD